MAVTAQTITLPTQSHSLSVPKTLRKLLSVCKSPLTDPESDASQVGGGYTGKISCQTGLQKRLAASIYGAEDEPQISDVAYYSDSSQPLLQYMENSLMGMEPVFLRPILQALGLPLGEATVNSVVRLVELVARILRKNQYRQLTIDTLIRKLFDEDMDPVPTLASVAARLEPAWELRRGIFALLGTLMMSYQVPDDMEDEFYLLRPRTEWMLGVRKTPDMIHAPIGRFIGYFGRFVPRVSTYGTEERKYEPTEPDTTELRVSTLNAYVLTKLGMVEFIWSDLLSEHLSFDRFSRPRTLKMFRFASFCALNYLPGEQDSLFDRIMDSHLSHCADLRVANKSMHREVLLSYHLLFGQHGASRHLFNTQERERASGDGILDPLLARLCGKSEDISEIFEDGTSTEPGLYDAGLEFPFLAQRLIRLQEFASSRTPRGYVDVWRDKRDPSKWITIWVALLIALATVVLSVIQTVFTGIQTFKR